MYHSEPDQKVIRFDNPKDNNRDADIWPWLQAQKYHLRASVHLLIKTAAHKYGNQDYLAAAAESLVHEADQHSVVSNSANIQPTKVVYRTVPSNADSGYQTVSHIPASINKKRKVVPKARKKTSRADIEKKNQRDKELQKRNSKYYEHNKMSKSELKKTGIKW